MLCMCNTNKWLPVCRWPAVAPTLLGENKNPTGRYAQTSVMCYHEALRPTQFEFYISFMSQKALLILFNHEIRLKLTRHGGIWEAEAGRPTVNSSKPTWTTQTWWTPGSLVYFLFSLIETWSKAASISLISLICQAKTQNHHNTSLIQLQSKAVVRYSPWCMQAPAVRAPWHYQVWRAYLSYSLSGRF